MKRLFLILTFFIIFVFFTPISLAQTGFGGIEHIEKFDTAITIQKDGKIHVREDIKYDFGTLSRHGIFREIPFTKVNQDGKKFKLAIENISVVDELGEPYKFDQSTLTDIIKLKIGDPNRTITGQHTYLISYDVSGSITYFSDHEELWWNAIGNGWDVPVAEAEITLIVPKGGGETYKYRCYTGYDGAEKDLCTIKSSGNSATITAINSLAPNEGLGFVASFPIDLVARLEPEPVVAFADTVIGKLFFIALGIGSLLWYLIYPVWIAIRWYIHGRDPDVGPEVTALFEGPKTKKGREMTPGETGALVDEMVDFKDVSATVVDLARRGYLKIIEKDKEFTLEKTTPKDNKSTLQEFEQQLYDGLFPKGNLLSLEKSNTSLISTITDVEKTIYKSLVTEGFFEVDPGKVRGFYTVVGALALFTLNFQLAFCAFVFGRNMPKKTLSGTFTAQKARSLKNFLKSQERHFEFAGKKGADFELSPQFMFEKFLPFAIAFGVEKQWIKRFEKLTLENPDWYVSSNHHFTTAVFANSLNSSMSSFRDSATPTRSSSGFSSGGGGGGFSGGGGGGGGGSW